MAAKPTRRLLILLAALALCVAVVLTIVGSARDGSGTTAPTASPEGAVSAGGASTSSSVPPVATDARAPRRPVSEHSATERAAMLAAITKARTDRADGAAAPVRPPAVAGARTTGSDPSGTTLEITDKTGDTSDWEKRALTTVNQMLGQCYDLGLAEDAKLAGNVTIRFTVNGEPGVGALLESVAIVDAATTISQATIRDCFTQQLYALELDPPPDGVRVERELSLTVP